MVCLVYTTFPDIETARGAAGEMVKQKLAACANLFPAHESIYEWDGNVQNETEHAVIFKTTSEKVKDLEKAFIAAHPYDVPCFVVLPVEDGHTPFLEWITAQTR